jgi:hypothetical protein
VRWNGGFHLVSDPFRHPVDAVGTLLPWHPIGSIVDKILVGILRLQVRSDMPNFVQIRIPSFGLTSEPACESKRSITLLEGKSGALRA